MDMICGACESPLFCSSGYAEASRNQNPESYDRILMSQPVGSWSQKALFSLSLPMSAQKFLVSTHRQTYADPRIDDGMAMTCQHLV